MISELLRLSNLHTFNLDTYQKLVGEISQTDKDDLDGELARHPATYSYYHGILVIAKREMEQENAVLDTYAATYKTMRRKERKYSVAELDDETVSQEEYCIQIDKVQKCAEIYGLVKAICNMLEHKKDILVQLSANKRMEAKIYS